MSSEQTFSTSDLRGTAQDYKRDAARKHKWALGATDGVAGRADEKPRPYRPSETGFNAKRRDMKHAVAALTRGSKVTRKQDMLEEGATVSDDSAATNSDEYEDGAISPPEGVMYSFDAMAAPSQGSQILNVALAKAVERFEERETVRLVKDEYAVLDTTGEVLPQSTSSRRKGKGKTSAAAVPDADEDYEFV